MQIKAAKTLSNVLNPFGVAAIISIVLSWFSPMGSGPTMSPLSSASIGILTLCIFPFLPVVYSAKSGKTDLDVSEVGKRVPLYGLGLLGYALGAMVFLLLGNWLMSAMALAYLCVGMSMLLITLAWKISAHTAGVAGPTTALVFVFGMWVVPLYLLSLLMIWARVRLRAHTLSQAVAGMLVAILVTSLVFMAFYLPWPHF
jgi:membrane-associated phospholipid phosphatase